MTFKPLPVFVASSAFVAQACGPGAAVSQQPAQADVASATCDVLSPVPSPVANPYHPIPDGHESAVTATLFSQVVVGRADSEDILIAMVKDAIPSPEEAVYVLAPPPGAARTGKFRVVHARATVRVPPSGPSVEAKFAEAFLDAGSVLEVERVWAAMTGAARWPNRAQSLTVATGASSTNGGPSTAHFTFDYRGDNVFFQGIASSPDAGTCTQELSSIGEALMRFADVTDDQQRDTVREHLLSTVGQLSRRLGLATNEQCGGAPCRAATPDATSALVKNRGP